jgi:hypothetical protein
MIASRKQGQRRDLTSGHDGPKFSFGERHKGRAAKGSRVATPTAVPKLGDLGMDKTQRFNCPLVDSCLARLCRRRLSV